MAYQITIQSSPHQFEANENETVLDAAIRQNVPLPYGCRSGLCGKCKAKVLSGKIKQKLSTANILTPQELQNNLALLCLSHAHSNLRLESALTTAKTEPKIFTAHIQSVSKLDQVAIVHLLLPEPMHFEAGQYVDILLEDGAARSFSIANSPFDHHIIELHIRKRLHGKFSQAVFSDQIKPQQKLTLKGPMGDFYVHESSKPLLLICAGTGFAPIQSILEYLIKTPAALNRRVALYRGARSKSDLYLEEHTKSLQKKWPSFNYVPVLSSPTREDAWAGRTGYVQEAVLEDYDDLSNYQAYVCGGQQMVEDTQQALIRQGLPEGQCYSDTFFAAPEIEIPR